MTSRPPTPIIAIVGRPNVGKSTLFNRFARSRRALVADTPGLTRDRIAEEVEVSGRAILLVDTAGLEPPAGRDLTAAVQAQARGAVEDADAILFVVDGQSGLLPEDEAIAQTLRKTDKPLVVAVNKIDVPVHASRVGEFHRLGFDQTVATSAEHGTGCFDAIEGLVAALPGSTETASDTNESADVEEEGDRDIRVALVGRPNVGKSSLANRLFGAERVVVSEVPGTTRDSIDMRIETPHGPITLVDTAGLRRPGKRTQRVERGSALMTVKSLERADVALLLIDADEGFTDQDAHVANLIRERGCAGVVLANKWDLVDKSRADDIEEGIRHGLRFMADAPVLRVSAKTGLRLGRLWPHLRQVYEAGRRRVPTAELNRWLEETVTKHEPSMARRGPRRRPIKFFYGTQTGILPPTFVLFCTEPRAILPAYRRFLENQLRARFDFAGTPVRLRLRSRKEGGKPRRSGGDTGRSSRRR